MSQVLSLAEQLKNLVQLQELDLKIDAIKKSQNSLPSNLKTLDDSLTKLRTAHSTKKNQIEEIQKTKRQTQAALEINQDRLSRANSKLEAVHNAQEFQAANKEIDQLKKLNSSLEDQNKKSDTELEEAQKEFSLLEEQIENSQKERDAQFAIVTGQDHQFNNDVTILKSERMEFSSKVEPGILAQYNRIRNARGGLGVVPAVGGRCKGCNMVVPPQLYNEVQKGTTLHSCPSCNRILFVAPAPAPEAPQELQKSTG